MFTLHIVLFAIWASELRFGHLIRVWGTLTEFWAPDLSVGHLI